MKRSLHLDFPSAAVGGALTLALTALLAMSPSSTSLSAGPLRIGGTIGVHGLPRARDMVRVVQGAPLTVPPNRIFVATGVGLLPGNQAHVDIQVNGVTALRISMQSDFRIVSLPAGVKAVAGETVEPVESSTGHAVLMGNLDDA